MADVDYTSVNVRDASPQFSIKIPMIAAVAIEAGQVVYQNSAGKVALADASAAGTAQALGIAMRDAGANQAVTVLVFGMVEGFTLASIAYDTILTLSDTAGDLDDGAGSPTVDTPIGKVQGLTDNSISKVLFVNCLDTLVTARS